VPYVVTNQSREGAVVAPRVEEAARWGERLKGLLGRSELPEGEGLHIVPCNSIHMFFMRFPIDVAFLDPEGRVVRAIHRIKPWRATRVYLEARSALELKAGALERSGTREGDLLRFERSA
jgi:uncharacterized membrane protein (UPF0127 family)